MKELLILHQQGLIKEYELHLHYSRIELIGCYQWGLCKGLESALREGLRPSMADSAKFLVCAPLTRPLVMVDMEYCVCNCAPCLSSPHFETLSSYHLHFYLYLYGRFLEQRQRHGRCVRRGLTQKAPCPVLRLPYLRKRRDGLKVSIKCLINQERWTRLETDWAKLWELAMAVWEIWCIL